MRWLLGWDAVLLVAGGACATPLTGLVSGPDDRPVPRVRVLAVTYLERGSPALAEVQTDEGGRFAVTPAEEGRRGALLVALKDGYATVWQAATATGDNLLRLGADPVVRTGRVLTAEGAPLAGAEVVVRALARPRPPTMDLVFLSDHGPLSCVTDGEGRFAFGGLSRDTELSLRVCAAGRAAVTAQTEAASAAPLELHLPREATISGRITHQGQGAGGVEVFCQPVDGPEECSGYDHRASAADGSYKLQHLPPGTYNVMIEGPAGLTAAAVAAVRLQAGTARTGADFALTPGAVVRGRLREEKTGQPVTDALVAAYGPARPVSSAACQNTRSAADGSYELRLPPGRSMIYYQGTGGYTDTARDERWVELKEGEVREGLDFVLRPPLRVTGQVLDAEGQPDPAAEVVILGEFDYRLPVSPEGQFQVVTPQGSTNWGTERVSGLLVRDAGRGEAALVKVAPGLAELQVRLQPAAWLAVPVLDRAGQPVAGATLSLYAGDWNSRLGEWSSGADGLLRCGPLPPGAALRLSRTPAVEALTVEPIWWRDQEEQAALSPGQQRSLPPLVLDPAGRTVKLWVGEANQQPLPGALVVVGAGAFPVRERRPALRTGPDGRLELTGLPLSGKVTVVAMHPTLPHFAAVTVDPGWNYWPGLTPVPLGAAAGRVVDPQGKPLAGLDLLLRSTPADEALCPEMRERLAASRPTTAGAGDAPERPFGIAARTDADGRWRADGLIDGAEYALSVEEGRGRFQIIGQFAARAAEAPQDAGTIAYGEAPKGR